MSSMVERLLCDLHTQNTIKLNNLWYAPVTGQHGCVYLPLCVCVCVCVCVCLCARMYHVCVCVCVCNIL